MTTAPEPDEPEPPDDEHDEAGDARKRVLMIVVRIVAVAAIAVALWFFIRKLDTDALGNAFASALLWPLVLGAALNFVCLFGKAASWRIMFWPRYSVPLLRLFRYTIAAFAGSAIAPARAGELLRVIALKRRDGVPASSTIAVAFAEKLLCAITLLVLVAPVPWLLPGLPAWVTGAITITAVVSIGVFVVLWVAVGLVDPSKTKRSMIRRFVANMHVLRSARRLLGALFVLTLVWFADLGMILLGLYAVGIDVPIAGAILILFTVNLAILVPSTPAQVGALQLGALAALDLLNVPHEQGLAFALLYHLAQIIPLVIVGLLLEVRLVLGRPPTVRPEKLTV
jgi:uncharacterized membrane protein YbhN (UPF0104 family)